MPKTRYIYEPLTKETIEHTKDKDNYISVIIAVPFCDVIESEGYEAFWDTISCKIVGDDLLQDIAYTLHSIDSDTNEVLLKVTAHVGYLFEEEEGEEAE